MEDLMNNLKTLVEKTEGKVACVVTRLDNLIEINRSEQTDHEAFMASKQEWSRGLVDNLILVQRRL